MILFNSPVLSFGALFSVDGFKAGEISELEKVQCIYCPHRAFKLLGTIIIWNVLDGSQKIPDTWKIFEGLEFVHDYVLE